MRDDTNIGLRVHFYVSTSLIGVLGQSDLCYEDVYIDTKSNSVIGGN